MNKVREAITTLGAQIEEEAETITDVLTTDGTVVLSLSVGRNEYIECVIKVREQRECIG